MSSATLTASREHAVRWSWQARGAGFAPVSGGVGSELSPITVRELYNLASNSELLLGSGSNGSRILQRLTALNLYRVTSSCLCQYKSIVSVAAWPSWWCLCRSMLGGLGGGSGHDNQLWVLCIYVCVFLLSVVEHT